MIKPEHWGQRKIPIPNKTILRIHETTKHRKTWTMGNKKDHAGGKVRGIRGLNNNFGRLDERERSADTRARGSKEEDGAADN